MLMKLVLILIIAFAIFIDDSKGNIQRNYSNILKKNIYDTPKPIGYGKFYDSSAKEVYLKDFKDKFIILAFTADWCIECSTQTISLDKLKKNLNRLKIEDLEIITIYDNSANYEIIRNFYQKLNLNDLKIFYDPNNNLMQEFGVNSPPAVFFIDKKGQIIAKYINIYNWDSKEIMDFILQLKNQ
ncbi:MAG: peroxiredoxin [Candidatus Midichloriaceae bacterium]|jgi:peroxiredoxin